MGRKCCVPNCSSNYDAVLKNGLAATSTFKFPDDAALHDLWVKAIRRPSWLPSKRASVCIHHFKPDDILRYDKPAKLKPGAVPCLFGELLLHGRSGAPAKRGRPRKVREPAVKDEPLKAETFSSSISCARHVLEDCILNFDNFKAYVREKLQQSKWMILSKSDIVHLFSLDDVDDQYPLRIDNSIKVYSDLRMKLYTREEEQTEKTLQWILGVDNKLLRWSQLITIVHKYDDASRHKAEVNEHLDADQPVTDETVEAEKFASAGLLEEHLDDTMEEKELMSDVEANDDVDAMAGTTIKLEIEKQQEHFAVDDNFIDIGSAHSVQSEDSASEPDLRQARDGSTEPLISQRKPILSQVRELQRVKFKCFVCNTDQGTRARFDQHMPTHLPMLPYHCTRCTKEKVTIKTLASLNKHFLMHRKPLKCRLCDVRFTTYASRVLHEQCKHGSNATYTCEVCQKECSSKRTYRYHRKIHDDPAGLRCKICHRPLSSAYEVKLHMRTHTGEKPNKCSFCAKSFNRRSNLTEHIRRFHSMERPFDCGVCGERFMTNVTLKKHMTAHDLNTEAPKVTNRPSRVSCSAKVLQCKDCDRKFVSQVSYHSHRRQHDKRYQCSYCGIRIAQLRDFEDHENIHTGARPYECQTCGKTFRTASTYYGHVLVHGSEKKHFCKICNKGFLRYHHVQVHMRTHTGEKPHRCDTCGRKYADKTAYTRHQLTHRPTVGDMLRAKEIERSINFSVPDRRTVLPVERSSTAETFDPPAVGVQIGHQMNLVFSTAADEEEDLGVLPSIMGNVLDGECPVVFEYLSEDSYMTDLPHMITTEEGRM